MRICGIISEFNPFHNGHKYLIEQARGEGFESVICVMSGEFVQRGEYASFDKHHRALSAVENGADLVLSIPFPWCCASAEYFAKGAVSILNALNCVDSLVFGSESGDKIKLDACFKILKDISRDDITKKQRENSKLSFARARQLAVAEVAGDDLANLLESPNDILAIEYLKAIEYLNSPISFIPIKRTMASHDGKIGSDIYSSSSYIRSLACNGEIEKALRYMPDKPRYFADTFRQIDQKAYFDFLCGAVTSRTPYEISEFAENGGGFEYVLYNECLRAKNYSELFSSLRAKHLTDSKIRRALLFASLALNKHTFDVLPAFTEVLACNERGKQILASVRKNSGICILSKPGNIGKASDLARSQYDTQRKAELIFKKLTLK